MTAMTEQSQHTRPSEILLGRPLGVRAGSRPGAHDGRARKVRKVYSLDRLNRRGHFNELQHFRGTQDLTCTGEGHLMTIAPTGSGKGCSAIIPNLLRYEGSVIVTDPKGENYAVTARAREALGHKVYKLNPFHVIDDKTDCLNPFDVFDLPRSDLEINAQAIGDLLMAEHMRARSVNIWSSRALGLLDGLIAYITALDGENIRSSGRAHFKRNRSNSRRIFGNLLAILNDDDIHATVGQILHMHGAHLPPLAHRELSSFLLTSSQDHQQQLNPVSILRSEMRRLSTEAALATLNDSTIRLSDVVQDRPLSIYLIVPPDKLKSHNLLLRLWIGTILRAVTSRQVVPQKRTLLIVDECAQLGPFPLLEDAITLSRSYGLQTWTFWQDLAQLQQFYSGWETMVNNCEVLQSFGANNHAVTTQLARLLGIEEREIRELSEDEQIVMIDGTAYKCTMCDYRMDPQFEKRFDRNPYYNDGEPPKTQGIAAKP
jgi:type IV secretion system protein VirD4